jgi:hypothetical protein
MTSLLPLSASVWLPWSVGREVEMAAVDKHKTLTTNADFMLKVRGWLMWAGWSGLSDCPVSQGIYTFLLHFVWNLFSVVRTFSGVSRPFTNTLHDVTFLEEILEHCWGPLLLQSVFQLFWFVLSLGLQRLFITIKIATLPNEMYSTLKHIAGIVGHKRWLWGNILFLIPWICR